MRNFTKIRWFIAIFAFLSTALSAQVNNKATNEGVLRVKLKAQLSTAATKARTRAGVLSVGHSQFDAASKSVKAYRMERVFPYNEKNEERYKKHGLDRWYEIHFDTSIAPLAAVSHYANIGDVEIAEPAFEVKLINSNTPSIIYSAADLANDPYLDRQWHYNNTGDVAPGLKGADINLFNAWGITKGRPEVIVSVVDGGIDINHNDLKQNLWVNEAELNGTPGEDSDGNGYIDDIYGANFIDMSGKITAHEHGTHVAGTVSATNNNGLGVAGVAGGSGNGDGVRIMSCQVFDSKGLSGNFARAIVYGADNGAVISQNSWGYLNPETYEQVVHDAIDYFIAEAGQYPGSPMQGGVVIFAAGNDASYYKYYPGAYENVVTVAAMGPDFKVTSYSNYGDWVDIVAPGGESNHGGTWGVLSTYPDNRYTYMDGTSMACPHVSGIAALVASKFASPTFTATELKQRLLTATKNIEQYNPEYIGLLGHGYIDAVMALAENGLKAPEKVSDLSVVGIAQDFAELTWSAVADEDDQYANRYEIYYSKTPITATSLSGATMLKVAQENVLAGEAIKVMIEDLAPLTTYYFAVMAYDRWNNVSELSEVVSATTNEGPKFVLPTETTTFEVDVTVTPFVSAEMEISNEAAGLLRWEGAMRHVGQEYSYYANQNLKPEVSLAQSLKPGSVKGVQTASVDATVKAATGMTTQEILRYGKSGFYVIGAPVATYEHMAATMYITSTGFNLTDVYAFLKLDENVGPMRLDIIEGNILNNKYVVHSQEIYSNGPTAQEYRIKLDEQIFLPPGAFWINIVSPKNNVHPFGIAEEYEVESSSFCFLSIDGGKTFTTVEDAMRQGGYQYPETTVWDMAAVSNNRHLGEYLKLSPATGTVAGFEKSTVSLVGNGADLIQGTYNSNITFKTNDPAAPEVKCPVKFVVKGQKAKLTSEKIINFNDVFVGSKKTFSIEVANEGLAPYTIGSIQSSNPAFRITNYNSRISAQGSININVEFAPTTEGSQSSTISVSDKEGNAYTFSVYGIGCIEGELAFEPAVVDLETLSADVAKDTTITVIMKNIGKYPLEYAFMNYIDDLDGTLYDLTETNDCNGYGYRMEYNIDQDATSDIQWQEHTDNVVDITNKYTFYERSVALDLGFSFPLYDKTYDTLYIADNATLVSTNEISLDVCMPPMANITCWQGAAAISAAGFRLKMNPMSKVSYSKASGKVIVNYEFVSIEYFGYYDSTLDIQIVLHESGDIDINYRNISYDLLWDIPMFLIAVTDEGSADSFIVNDLNIPFDIDGDKNNCDLTENMGFRIIYPGKQLVKSVSEPKGMLQIGESKELTLNIRLEDLSQGELKQNINILTSNTLTPMRHLTLKGEVTEGGASAFQMAPAESKELGSVLRTSPLRTAIQLSNTGSAPLTINELKTTQEFFSFTPITDKVIAAKSTYLVDIVCDTEVSGDFEDVFTAVVDGQETSVKLSYTVIPEPILVVDRAEIDTVMEAGVKALTPFVFYNEGESDLTVRIEGTNMVYPSLEGDERQETSYIYKRSDEDRSVLYNWVDLKSESAQISAEYFVNNRVNHFGVVLPFEFEFYGIPYDTMWVHKAGFVSFQPLPVEERPEFPLAPHYIGRDDDYNNFIAPMWGYHLPSPMTDPKDTGIFVYKDENQVVIHWGSYTDSYGISPAYDFQMILSNNGNIKFQYKFTRMPSWTTYAAGAENKDASDAVIISNGAQVLYQSVAIEVIPAQSFTIPAKEQKKVDFAIDGTSLYANYYNQQVKVISNDPRSDAPTTLNFSVELTGEAEMTIDDVVDFGEMIISPYDWCKKSFTLTNTGTDYLTIENMKADDNLAMAVEMFEKITTPWASFEDYFPIEDLLPITLAPKESKEFRLNSQLTEPTVLAGNLTISSSIGEKIIAVTGTLVNPPMLEMTQSRIDAVTNSETAIIDTALVLSNKNGESVLRYQANIEYIRKAVETEVPSASTFSKDSIAKPLSLVAATVTDAPATATTAYNRVLSYIDEDASPSNFFGFGKDMNFVASTSYTAPADGFQLSHVQSWYRPGDLQLSNIYVYILVGDVDPGNCQVIGQGRVTVESPEIDNIGSYITVELDEVTPIYPGEIFHVMFSYPLGASNPQGHILIMPNRIEDNRYFYADGTSWVDIAMTAYSNSAYMMRALEAQADNNFWVILDGESSGEIKAGEELGLGLKMNSALLSDEIQHANLHITTNDPKAESTIVPLSFSANSAPVVAVNAPSGVMTMQENEKQTFGLNVYDKEGDSFELALADDAPAFVSLTNEEGTYALVVDADYESAGNYTINVLAKDSWGKESINGLKLTITNVNRAPICEAMPELEIGIEEFSQEIDLNVYFADPDQETLKYEFSNGSPEVVRVFLSDNNLLVKGVQLGEAEITIKATDPWGESTEQVLKATVTSSTGIHGATDSDVIVTPNPVVTTTLIDWGSSLAEEVSYAIYSNSGAKVMAGTMKKHSVLNVQQLTTGVYYLVLDDNTTRKTVKLVKE